MKEYTQLSFFDKNLRIIYSITLTAIMGVASLSPALPEIQQYFSISKVQTGYLIMIFTLPGIVLTPVLGILADRFGRKTILVPSLFLFGISGMACAFANSFSFLLLFRFFQGVGAAALGSLNVTIIGDIFEGRNRGVAMGYNASVLSIGTALYPSIGGALAQIDWNYPFLLPIIAIPVGFWVMNQLKLHPVTRDESMKNFLGSAAKTVFKKEPLVLFSVSTLSFVILYGAIITYFPFLMNEKFQASPVLIGGVMSTMSFSSAITSSRLGLLQKYFSIKQMLLFAFVLYAISCILIPFSNSLTILVVPVLLFGIAQGINLPNLLTIISNLAPDQHRAVFMSTNGMALRLGQTLGPLIMGAVFAFGGINLVFVGGTVIALILFLMVGLNVNNR